MRKKLTYTLHSNYQTHYNQLLRLKVLAKLGGKCVRCGFDDPRALQIDHINGGGVKEIKNSNGPRARLRKILTGERTDLQLLCANCNWIKRVEREEHGGWKAHKNG